MRGLFQLLTLVALAAAALFAQERVVLTQDDLLRMADTGLPASLIIRVIETADVVPVLQPQDITDLAQKGVPVEALEAVIARRATSRSASPKETPQAAPVAKSRISVTATLEQRRGGLIGSLKRDSGSSFPIYWGAAARDADGAILPIDSCPKQPACWCVSETGQKTCVTPEDAEWKKRFSCFQAMELAPGDSDAVLELEPPAGMTELRVYPFYMVQEKNGAMRLASWESAGSSSYLSIESGPPGFTAEAGLALSVGRNANTDLSLPVKRFDSGGERPGSAGRIALKTLLLSTTPLPQFCKQ